MIHHIIREHEQVPYSIGAPDPHWKEGMRLPPQKEGLDRWFFHWQWHDFPSEDGLGAYCSSYVIGAQWFDTEQEKPLVIVPKEGCGNIDFLKMFDTCFNNGEDPESFSKIYDVDFSKSMIDAPQLNSVLSPLIIVHFLSVVKSLIRRGLKKNYIDREDSLKKVRGRIVKRLNDRKNIMQRRYDRIHCRFSEYSENIPENRLIKKALIFSKEVLNNSTASRGLQHLKQTVSSFISQYASVDENISVHEVKNIKYHKLYKEYSPAIKLAKLILKRFDYSLTNIKDHFNQKCPVFWLDMSLLYEHYVLGLLREAYGDNILFQAKGYTGCPDFICINPKMVLDTKYIPRFKDNKIDTDICRQLCGYARDRRLFPESSEDIIPCVAIYPIAGSTNTENPFLNKNIESLFESYPQRVWELHTIPIPLPLLPT